MAADADQSPWLERLRALADEWTADPATRDVLAGALLTAVALVALLVVVRLSNRLLRRVHAAIPTRRHIQDLFAEAKIEILSPHVTAVRDGAAPVLP
jgi:hypothetical protein